MAKPNEPKTIAEYIDCLSHLEANTSKLYNDIAEKTEMPLVKAHFQEIAIDSQKHHNILQGVSKSICVKNQCNRKECGEKIGQSWEITNKVQKEIGKINKIDSENLSWLIEKLGYFESIMGEEYYIFVQLKTIQILVNEINKQYNIDLSSIKSIFNNIIKDEDHHRELLEIVRQLVTKKEKEEDNSPAVKYQNPDAWNQAMPNTF
jgi:rubrerythrin